MIKSELMSALILVSNQVKRSMLAVLTMLLVGAMTIYALVGLLPFFDWVSVNEALFLSAIILVVMAVYFEFISPSREEVSSKVTSCLAILGGIISTLTANAVHPIPLFESMYAVAAGTFLVLIVSVWFWFEIIYLRGFRRYVEDAAEIAPLPRVIENIFIEDGSETEDDENVDNE